MADVQHEGAAADGSAVDPGRRDAKIVTDLLRRLDRGCKSVDVGKFQACIGDRVQRRVRMKLNLRHVGNDAELGGFCRAYDGDLVSAHDPTPSPDGTREG